MKAGSIFTATSFALGCTAIASKPNLPTVDLGYQVHQALTFNETTKIYNFTNIPYAEPPLGELRFTSPVSPRGRVSAVQDGHVGKICPQANPDWLGISFLWATAWGEGKPFNFTQAVELLKAMPPQAPDGRITEDCLVLDVLVTKKIFDGRNKKGSKGAPVLVYIHGGGYVIGEKGMFGSPDDLLAATQRGGSDGAIFVSLNYRLGAFGWLSGPTLEGNGSANVGLLDQRHALDWVQENIHKFGGNKDDVTIMGLSAGGGSIMHQLTAYGGLKPVPFHRAIPRSIGFVPAGSNEIQEDAFNEFLSVLNSSSIEEARKLPSSALLAANLKLVGASPWGTFTVGPVPDNSFVPGTPQRLISEGAYAKDIPILSAHVANEGILFMDPRSADNDTMLRAQVQGILPKISEKNLDFILKTLYPPVYDGSKPWKNPVDRVQSIIGDLAIKCNHRVLSKSAEKHGTPVSEYLFSIPPALHGDDEPYAFTRGPSPDIDAKTASIIQSAIAGFVMQGVPAKSPVPGAPSIPPYGSGSSILNLAVNAADIVRDLDASERCDWWEKALYY